MKVDAFHGASRAATYALGLAISVTACFDCSTELLSRVSSPNGEVDAVRWYRNCGAMHSGSIGITLLAPDEDFDRDEPLDLRTVFQYRVEVVPVPGETLHIGGSAPPIPIVADTVVWQSDHELVVAYDARRPVIRQVVQLGDVTMSFRSHYLKIPKPPQN